MVLSLKADPNVDPKILQSCLLGPKMASLIVGNPGIRLLDGIPWFLASSHGTRHRDAIRGTREPTTWPTTVLESRLRRAHLRPQGSVFRVSGLGFRV